MKHNNILLLPLFALTTLVACTGQKSSENTPTRSAFEKVKKLSFIAEDVNPTYSPLNEKSKILVVPITFKSGSSLSTWTNTKLLNLREYYFGEKKSLTSYYKTMTFDKVNISGFVTDPIEETKYSSYQVNADSSMSVLFDMIQDVAEKIQIKYSNINWNEYDLNNDGMFDNIHMITNYNSNVWAEPLWPHMYHTDKERTSDHLGVNVYSISAINHMTDAITSIHEQGHIFGLEDYYDYSYKGVDYIGGADMQSNNVFDWNSFSKMQTGVITPYIYKGSRKEESITLSAASINGDCLLIPANYKTWNGSAYDEYFLIELFSPYGNNEADWSSWGNLGDYGVRMYHVDARLYGSNVKSGDFIKVTDWEQQRINSLEDIKKYKYTQIGSNNCYDWRDYEGGIKEHSNYQLLQIVQKGGSNTFATPGGRTSLKYLDLFKQGDEFTFNKYNTFLTKDKKAVTTTNEGEEFPWKITFSKMSKEKVTITISKNK